MKKRFIITLIQLAGFILMWPSLPFYLIAYPLFNWNPVRVTVTMFVTGEIQSLKND